VERAVRPACGGRGREGQKPHSTDDPQNKLSWTALSTVAAERPASLSVWVLTGAKQAGLRPCLGDCRGPADRRHLIVSLGGLRPRGNDCRLVLKPPIQPRFKAPFDKFPDCIERTSSCNLSLCEIQAGNWPEALYAYHDATALHRHSGGPQQRMSDGRRFVAFPNSPAIRATPPLGAQYTITRSGAFAVAWSGLADLHVIVAQAVMGGRSRARFSQSAGWRYGARGALPVRILLADAVTRVRGVRARGFFAAIEVLARSRPKY